MAALKEKLVLQRGGEMCHKTGAQSGKNTIWKQKDANNTLETETD